MLKKGRKDPIAINMGTLRTHDLNPSQQMRLSPAARAVYERLRNGTFEIDVERLADALLARFETLSPGPCACKDGAVPDAPAAGDIARDGARAKASLSRAR